MYLDHLVKKSTEVDINTVGANLPQPGISERLGSGLQNWVRNTRISAPLKWTTSAMEKHPLLGLGAGALLGAGIGTVGTLGMNLWERFRNRHLPEDQRPDNNLRGSLLRGAGLTALISGLGAGGLSYWHHKNASFMSGGNIANQVINKLGQDPSLSGMQKNQLAGMIQNLPQQQLVQLNTLLGNVTGAGIGALIAKFLLNLGFTGTVLMTLVGGAVGGLIGSSRNQNPMQSQNMFGQSRLF